MIFSLPSRTIISEIVMSFVYFGYTKMMAGINCESDPVAHKFYLIIWKTNGNVKL